MNMREEFEKWCAKNEANPNNYYFSEGWKAAWHARDAEIESLKAKHAELVEALRVVGPFRHVAGDSARRLSPDSGQRVNHPVKWIVGEEVESKRSVMYRSLEFINAAIKGEPCN